MTVVHDGREKVIPHMKKLANITAAVLLSSLVLAGCGDDSDSDASGTAGDAASETSESPSEESSDDSSEEASDDASADASDDADESDLEDTDFGKPAPGAKVKGADYSYTIPKEWKEITQEAKKIQPSVDTAAGEAQQTDTFRDNVNVGFNKAPGATLEQLEASVPQQLKQLAPKVKTLDHVVIDGQEAIHHRGVAALKNTKYFLEQFATVDDDGKVMIITFSFSPDVKAAERDKVINGVLAGWKFD